MGLLDQVVGGMGRQPRRGGGLGGTLAAGVLVALLVKALRARQAQSTGAASPAASGGPGAALGGLLGGGGGLGGLLNGAGGGLGGLLSGLGGAGALGALIGHLQQSGVRDQAKSWVEVGPNQPVAPAELGAALGEDTIRGLEAQTGLDRHTLLAQLAQALPHALDEATPSGRPPTDDELQQITPLPNQH